MIESSNGQPTIYLCTRHTDGQVQCAEFSSGTSARMALTTYINTATSLGYRIELPTSPDLPDARWRAVKDAETLTFWISATDESSESSGIGPTREFLGAIRGEM